MRRWRADHREHLLAYRRRYAKDWYRRRVARDPNYTSHLCENLKRSILNRLLKRFQLTLAQYDALVARGCAICAGPPRGRGRYHFDHDHATGRFRGLLCTNCNSGIGRFKDKSDLLMRAAHYLRGARSII